jgi:glycosyltransferase involved in cell wall biosynthesis
MAGIMIDPNNPDFENKPSSPARPSFAYSPAVAQAHPYATIITPFYNTGTVFYETASSVFKQSLQQWEWLIINDGSSDPESLSILDEYRQIDPRVRVIDHETNRGLSAARNTGFQSARAEVVVQLDSDDLLEPTAVEKWRWFLESHPEYSFVKGHTVQFGDRQHLWQGGFHGGLAFLNANQVNPTSAVRKFVHSAAGGYDEADRGGLMDWDFWLRCASFGYWGATIPEFLDWYRRRQTHADLWADFDDGPKQRAYLERLRQKYAPLWKGAFPRLEPPRHLPNEPVPDELPCENRLNKVKPRLLLIAPWMSLGGTDKFNLDLLNELTGRGWEITIATTLKGDNSWLPRFARYTPDIFILDNFLRLADYPRFLRYLISSRAADVVMISHSELGYMLLPYLRAHFPDVVFIDYCHIEEEQWKHGGYPRMSIDYQELLDLNIVSSEHLKRWMVERGGDPQRVNVCYINVDPEEWRADISERVTVRQEMGLDETLPVILYAGRVCAQKQPRVFARTMLELHHSGSRFVALVAGDGPELEWLRSFIKRNRLSKQVRLLGELPSEGIKRLMSAADILFLPSRWEGIALTIYEAMACGLPVVSADVGGQRELVTAECGFLIARGDEQTEARQYKEILTALLRDPMRRKEMGEAGRERVSAHFRLSRMGERFASLIDQARDLHSAQPRPCLSPGLGRACAAQSVETLRLSQVCAELWANGKGAGWRAKSYVTLSRLLEPFYLWGVRRGIRWLPPLGEKVKKILLRPVQ